MSIIRFACATSAVLLSVMGPLMAGAQEAAAPSAASESRQQTASTAAVESGEWSACATRGIEGDVPRSVTAMLADQGGWYTPFTRPNATGPYDIRNLHQQDGDAARPRC